MPDLGSAYVNIVPKAEGIKAGMEEILGGGDAAAGAENAGKGLGKKLIGGLAAMGIGTALVNTVKDAFEAGGALQQSFGGLETIYGDAAEGAKAYAQAAASAGISANTYAEQAVSFGAALKQAYAGDTTKAMEAANTAIMDMADNAAKMGTPLESIQSAYQGFAKQNYTMLDNLKLGYGGTKEEMERLLADAEKLTGVHYDIDSLGDVYDAIHVIQGELGLTGVAAAEAESTFTGSMGALKASWENVLGALTTGVGLDEALENFSNSFGNFATNVIEMLANLAPQLPDLIVGLADVIIDNAPTFIAAGVELIVKLAAGLLEAIPTLIGQLPEIFNAIMKSFREVDWWSLGVNIIEGVGRGILSMGDALLGWISGLLGDALGWAKRMLGIASPSKVFADQVGKWIPAGMAEGIEDNMAPVKTSMQLMTDTAVNSVQPYSPAAAADGGDGDVLVQLLDALRNMKLDLYLDGKQITDCVTVRQRQAIRSGGVMI